MLPVYNSSAQIATPLQQYEFPLENQIKTEREIQQMLENAPSIYSDRVSQKAKEAWEERLWTNIQAHRHYQVRDQEEMVSERPGRKFHMQEFVRMLNTLPRRRWYLNPYSIRGMRGLSVSRGGSPPAYVCAIDNEIIPEWSQIGIDAHGLPKSLISRGWRAVTLNCISRDLISEDEIHNLFGFASGTSGQLYRKYLFEMRNHRLSNSELYKERIRTRLHEGAQ